ncbi:MAG: hypothetical protein PUF74_04625 [Sodaliphilus pleomorphus]|nr:hypothetical protein [Sodaliphilus pleomorphus]
MIKALEHDLIHYNIYTNIKIIKGGRRKSCNRVGSFVNIIFMANSLIPQELEVLIQEYLTDGVLTDKERQVILKKAEGMGLDRDEIDLYLDAQVQKIDIATDAAKRRQKGKTCPYCGGSVPQLTDKCPHCGETISAQASEELQEIFDNLEEALVDMKSGRDISRSKATVERYARKARMYYGSNPKIQKLLAEVENEMGLAEVRLSKQAKKESYKSLIANKWTWVWIVAIFFGIMFLGSIMRMTANNDRYEELAGKQNAWTGPENEEYWQLVAEKNKAYDGSDESVPFVCFVIGAAAVGYTVKLALKDAKKKEQ